MRRYFTFCQKCGNNLPDTAAFCGKCGAAANSPVSPSIPAQAYTPQTIGASALPKTPLVLTIIGTAVTLIFAISTVIEDTGYIEIIGGSYYFFVLLSIGCGVAGVFAIISYKPEKLKTCFQCLVTATILVPVSWIYLAYAFSAALREIYGAGGVDTGYMLFYATLFTAPFAISCFLVKKKL